MQVIGSTKPKGEVKAKGASCARGVIRLVWRNPAASRRISIRAEQVEHACWDPKDGELCLARLKSGETLMEDRSDSDVQIDRRSWV